jgi:uncharacterized membrane protein YhhN
MMIVDIDMLKFGLIYFLIAHIFYILAFSRGYRFKTWNYFSIVALFIYGLVIIYLVADKAGGLIIPVIIYTYILLIMTFFALARLNRGATRKSVFIALGASLFLISDTLVAINEYVVTVPHSTVFTWLLYAPAQLLIVLSCLYEEETG